MAINMHNVGNRSNLNVEQKQQKQEQLTRANEQAPSKPAASKDSVSLTPQAQALNSLKKQSSEPAVNRERVETLKKAILNGEYKIDADKLAKNMTEFEAKFGQSFGV
ncbi:MULTISPECIES: flagellar biosynthesis anti-sigma factor FlgM [unclassified Motilimonas]|uniref:flagellar biosynthesis anti-sigma factor FlgM n=1 Tax=Motilimonas TaxID=1914248 RepID=UPI001E2DE42E|nr:MULTISPECIES: flagellar biosynthesis anti-sigma factor FlgM [unclassified Motilimonas]MDO6524937.1 flagellar biosynthesis anti-sigma factor FlgM [Motilimonas sp. 1_MG-2023]